MRLFSRDTGRLPGPRNAGAARIAGPLLVGASVVLLLLAACDSGSPKHELAQRWLDALNSHNADRVIQMLASNATYAEPPPAAPWTNADLRGRLRLTWSVWKDQVYTAKAVIAAGDLVVIEWHLQQTHPNGKSAPIDGVTVLDVRDSHIQAVHNYYNASIYLQFMKPQ